jgi:hypothetical protein
MMPSDNCECCCQQKIHFHQGEKCNPDHTESKIDHSRSKRACVDNTGSTLRSLTCVPQVDLAVLIWQQSWQAERNSERLQQCLQRGSSCPLQSAAGQSDWEAALHAGAGPSSLASTAPQRGPGSGSQPLPAAVSTTQLIFA